jgi:hypothetical protein
LLNKLPWVIVAVVAGCETGVLLADRLAKLLSLPGNGLPQSAARRNKYLMGERVRSAGLRAVRQAYARVRGDVIEFCTTLASEMAPRPLSVVVKPVESAGSDDVHLCSSTEEALARFSDIIGKRNQLGKAL